MNSSFLWPQVQRWALGVSLVACLVACGGNPSPATPTSPPTYPTLPPTWTPRPSPTPTETPIPSVTPTPESDPVAAGYQGLVTLLGLTQAMEEAARQQAGGQLDQASVSTIASRVPPLLASAGTIFNQPLPADDLVGLWDEGRVGTILVQTIAERVQGGAVAPAEVVGLTGTTAVRLGDGVRALENYLIDRYNLSPDQLDSLRLQAAAQVQQGLGLPEGFPLPVALPTP